MRPRAFPRTLTFVSARTMRPPISLFLVYRSLARVLLHPFAPVVVFAALFSSLVHSLLVSVYFMQPLMMNSRRGNDWRVEQRFCYVRIAILLENFSLSSPIRLKFLGFNHPWKMLKLNSSLELKFGIGYYLETYAKFLINCKCRLYMIQNLLLILLS